MFETETVEPCLVQKFNWRDGLPAPPPPILPTPSGYACGDHASYFHENVMPQVRSNYNCIAVFIDFVLQLFLKECKYIEKDRKMVQYKDD